MTKSAKVFVAVTTTLIALSFVIALSLLTFYYVLSVREAGELETEGHRAAFAGDYDVAIAKYSAALQKPVWNQLKALLYTNRGYAYNAKRQFADAIADQTEAIRLNPQLSYAFAARGYAYLERRELDKAFADLTESIRLDPNSDSAYYNRGLLLTRRGEFSNALIDFDEAVRCSPERADRFVARALCYLAMDDFDQALASFDGAIAAEPGNAMGYLARSDFYGRRGNVDKQQRDFQQALRLNPNAGNLWIEVDKWFINTQAKVSSERKQSFLGFLSSSDRHLSPQQLLSRNAGKTYKQMFEEAKVAHDQGNYEDTIALYDDLLARSPSPILAASALMNRGNAYAAKGDLDKALQDCDEAIQLDPTNAGAYVDRALVLTKESRREEAIADYNEAIRIKPQQWQAYFNRAADFRDEGELTKAIADLTEVTKLNPKFVGSYVNRGSIYVRQGKVDEAIDDYNAALQLDPNRPEVYTARASAFLRKENYGQALADLRTAVQMKSKKPDVALNSLAWLRATCPKPDIRDGKEAVELATKACELSQWKNLNYIDTLAAAYAEVGNFDQAIKYQNQVVQMTKAPPDDRKFTQRLALYQQHKAYREEPN